MAERLSYSFRKEEHLRRPTDFKRVYDRRRSVSDEWLIVYGCENGLPHLRLGMSVSRKVGGAVQRNRLRRLYREAFRLTKQDMPTGLDMVVIPKGADHPTLVQLKDAFPKLVRILAEKLQKGTKPA
jgi:ribonuclease P protein component